MYIKIATIKDINETKRKFKEKGFNFSKSIENAIKNYQLIYIESNNKYGWLSILDWKNIDNNIGIVQNYNTDSLVNIDEAVIKLIKDNLHNYKEIYHLKVLNNNLNLYIDSGFEHVDTLVLYENTDMNYSTIKSKFHIIESKTSQLDQILRVDNLDYDHIWPSSINNRSIVVQDENIIIGCAIYNYIENDKKGYISRLSVDPMYQNRNIEKLIINDCIKWFKDKGASKVELITQKSNSKNRTLYENLGFKSVRELAVVKIKND